MNNYQVTMKSKRECGPYHHITSPWQHILCSFTSPCYTCVLFSWWSLEFLLCYPPRCPQVIIFYKAIKDISINLQVLIHSASSDTTTLEHFGHILRIFLLPLFLWTIARFGFHDWFILSIHMAREIIGGTYDVVYEFRPCASLIHTFVEI